MLKLDSKKLMIVKLKKKMTFQNQACFNKSPVNNCQMGNNRS